MSEELKYEVIAMLRIWLIRLEYSDPFNDKPGVVALLGKLES